MNDRELIAALRRLKVQTGSLACLGCGHEHNCSTSGCAIIREAVDKLCGMEWIDAEVELPPEDDVDAWPEWEGPTVTYWRPIPEPLEVG